MRPDQATMSLLRDILLCLLISMAMGQSSRRRNYYRGRHVCAKRQQVSYQRPVTQSYRKPVYNEQLKRTVYQTTYRTVLRVRFGDKLVPGCCPGWSKRSPRDVSCLTPVCKDECGHGRCIRPGICLCDRGWSGYKCDKDINECRSRRHKCQQQCINTDGSYECACHEGFKLGEDNSSCVLCLACSKEFQDIQQEIQTMGQRIQQLEAEKTSLETDLTSAMSKYDEAIEALHVVTRATPDPISTSTLDPNMGSYMPLDRLASLSQQISILEERMGSCMCNPDYMMR